MTGKAKAAAKALGAVSRDEIAEQADTVRGMWRGLAQAKMGLGHSVDAVFDDLLCGV